MSRLPYMQLYFADWRNNANLRRCSHAARGALLEIMGVMHDSDEYGVVRWPLKEIAKVAGVPMKLAKELVDKNVLKGSDDGIEGYVFRPVHARKQGAPVTLLEATDGPCWYSSRMVRDSWRRGRQGVGTRFDSENNPARREIKEVTESRDTDRAKADTLPGDWVAPIHSPTRRLGDDSGERNGAAPRRSPSSRSETETETYNTPLPPGGDGGDELQLLGEESKPRRTRQEEAEEIYRAYPKKVAKEKTLAAIAKALKECPFEELLAKTESYAKAKAGSDPQYTLHSLTFFNQKRFNDDPSTWARGGGGQRPEPGVTPPAEKKTPVPLGEEFEQYMLARPDRYQLLLERSKDWKTYDDLPFSVRDDFDQWRYMERPKAQRSEGK